MISSIVIFTVLVVSVKTQYMEINDPACDQNSHSVASLPYFNVNETQPCSYAGTLFANQN